MVDIYEYQNKTIKEIEDLVNTAGILNAELTDKVREVAEKIPHLKEWSKRMSTWRSAIYEAKDVEVIDKIYNGMTELIKSIMQEQHEAKMEEIKKDGEWWKEHYRKISESEKQNAEWWRKYNAEEHDWQKSQQKRDEENRKKLDESSKNHEKDLTEKTKKECIADIEMYLIKKKISGERLSQRLGVSDWKEKINQTSSWNEALSRRSDLWDIIRNLQHEFTCANCGVKKEEYTAYGVGSKKACSWECEKALKGEDKGIDKDDAKEIKKELQEIKDYLKKNNENANRVLTNLLAWMKEGGVINITLSNEKLVIELSGKKTKTIEESDLTSEQRIMKNYLQNASEKKSINRNELEKMVGGNYNEEGGKKKDSNGGIIAAIVIVGVVLAIIIGVVIHKNKKRDY